MNNVIIIFVIVLFSNKSFSTIISEEDIVKSSLKHFPLILKSLAQVQASREKVKESLGTFDSNLHLKNDQRVDGYYDGSFFEVKVEKPIQQFSSKAYVGLRKSNGNFPLYEGKMNTLSDGEVFAGFNLSLLRNREIDSKRLKLWNSQIDQTIKETKVKAMALKVKKMAKLAYWNWVENKLIYSVYNDLYQLAVKRNNAIKTRISKGDLAKIYETENKQYILKRNNKLLEIEQKLQKSSYNLSLFYRNNDGSPQVVNLNFNEKNFQKFFNINDTQLQIDIKKAIKNRPKFAIFDFKIKQILNEVKNSKNDLSPKLNLDFELSKDSGTGSKSLEEQEARAMIEFSLPIERNLGEGKIAKFKSQLNILNYERKYLIERFKVTAYDLKNKLNILSKIIENTKMEVKLAEELQLAEVKKFDKGASDFFVINIREQNLADAKTRLIYSKTQFKKIYAKYEELMFYPL